jgi:predicted transcriptional regulator
MPKTFPLPGGDLEARAVDVILELGRATARDVHARIGAPSGLAYTTIATVLDRLRSKGLLRRERDGKAFVYFPNLDKEVLALARAKDALRHLLRQDHKPAMAALVNVMEEHDPDLLDELARQIAERRRRPRGS